jgi:membrane-bound lytic murein transglycosylase D
MILRNFLTLRCSVLIISAFSISYGQTNQRLLMAFLPPAPEPVPSISSKGEAPRISSNPYIADSPGFLEPSAQLSEKPTQSTLRVQRAEERFKAGRELYQAGDMGGARQEFDRAVDILLGTPENVPDRAKVEKKLEQMVAAIHRYDVNGMGAGDLSGQQGYDRVPLEDILEMTFPIDPSLKPRVKEQVQVTSSQLPLQVTDPVLSYIHYFSTEKGRRTLIAGLKRSGRYRPLISRVLAEEGVPQELIYLAQAESGFFPRAVSNKAATGMWQFVQFRGRQYGLNQTPYADDRLDPEKATRSAARHLRDLYKEFGDWYLAIAGYNCGPGAVEKAVERTGYADYWELRNRNVIPKETSNYVPIILAMTIMMKNAKDYDLENIDLDPALEYESTTFSSAMNIALIADLAERPVSDLRELNPALLGNVAPSGFEVHIPKGSRDTIIAELQNVPESKRASWRAHRLTQGETLASVAHQFNASVGSLSPVSASASPEAGDLVLIPAPERTPRAVHTTVASRTPAKKHLVAAAPRHATANHTTANHAPAKTVRRTAAATVQTASIR